MDVVIRRVVTELLSWYVASIRAHLREQLAHRKRRPVLTIPLRRRITSELLRAVQQLLHLVVQRQVLSQNRRADRECRRHFPDVSHVEHAVQRRAVVILFVHHDAVLHHHHAVARRQVKLQLRRPLDQRVTAQTVIFGKARVPRPIRRSEDVARAEREELVAVFVRVPRAERQHHGDRDGDDAVAVRGPERAPTVRGPRSSVFVHRERSLARRRARARGCVELIHPNPGVWGVTK